MEIEAFSPDLKQELHQFFSDREYPSSAFANPAEMRDLALANFETSFHAILEDSEFFALAARVEGVLQGFLIAQPGQKESITQDDQTAVLTFAANTPEVFHGLLRQACERARAAGDEYLVHYTFESQAKERDWSKQFGSQIELLRTFMKVDKDDTFESHPDYRLRRAKEHEILFIMKVVAGHSPAYIPAHRPVDRVKIQASFVSSYSSMSARDKSKVPLVLERRSNGDLVGYMILQPGRVFGDSGPLGMYLYDIAIGPKGLGLGLSRYMALGSKQLMAKMGGGFLYGDVSPDNRLALSATLALGSRVDSRRWGIRL